MNKTLAHLKILHVLISALLCGTAFIAILNTRQAAAPLTAYADDNEYLRIISADTPFYADKSADIPLFYLPYTYYVKVINRGELFTHVEYGSGGAALDGYVPTEKLFYDGLTVETPFPDAKTLTAKNSVLYKNSALSDTEQFVFENRELYVYGAYSSPQGKMLYYVGYNDKLGYIKEDDVVPFTIENHPNELTFLKSETEVTPAPDTPTQETEKNSVLNLRIAIFTALGLAGIIALILSLRKKPKSLPAASYYDENDYE